ncbi:hypothetical protein BSKO_02244 [Bryopsis sp. KO-2023]|nr:hypothetical protein BSKO_02244 [Bryopsis sp. KO-2023]
MGALRWMFAVLATLCCSQWALANAKGFLEKAVPLNVIATTPTDLMTTEEPLIFSGAATITVCASETHERWRQRRTSVIALGSDFGGKDLPENLVPFFISQPELAVGRFRWVTTSIARWDPVNSWPPDARVTLQWNRDLKTYGDSSEVLDWDAEATLPIGIPFDITTPDVEIHTPPLTMFVHGVASDMAMDLTDNHWEASTGLKDDLLPEMPPDGKIVMEFSFPVELAAVEKAIKIVEVRDDVRKATEFRAKVSKCQSLRYSAAKLESNSNDEATCLTVSIKDGVLERGVKYEAIFPQGLRYNAKAGALTKEISFHFYGLRNFRIPFHPKIDIGGMTLRMWLPHGLASGTSVNDLKGAFSLTENSKNEEMPFEMSLESKGVMTLTAQFKPGAEYKISVNGDPNIRDGFGLPLESTAANILAEEANPYIAFFQSHLYVIGYDNENKIVQTDYQMVHMVWFAKGVRKVTLYLTRISDGKPYSDAALVAMRRKDDDELDYYDEDKLEHVKTFTTDAGGMVEFSPPPCVMATWRCSDYVYWVRKEKTNNMFSAYMSPTNPQERIELAGRLVLDRKVVEPGDELKIGGFLTQREGSSVLPFREAKHLQISTWLEGRRRAFGAFIDPQYGTFTATVKIPKDVDPGEYRLSIELEGPKFDLYLSQSYVIGRPRVPTATLTLITPPWVKPNATFEVEVQASSLLGPFVADAEMTLEWKVQGNYGKEFDENVEILRTNSTGGLSYTIDLANLTRPAVTGEMVEISVTWIGPTRERIRERATLRIQPTNMAVKLHRSLSTDLPNIEFGGWVSVTRTTEIGVIPLEGFPVSLELLSFPDSVDISDENEIRAQLSDPTHDGNFPVKLEKKCTALAGVPESQIKCRFQLPKMGHYGFRACAFDSIEDYTACSVDLLGKTLEEFTEKYVRVP